MVVVVCGFGLGGLLGVFFLVSSFLFVCFKFCF